MEISDTIILTICTEIVCIVVMCVLTDHTLGLSVDLFPFPAENIVVAINLIVNFVNLNLLKGT